MWKRSWAEVLVVAVLVIALSAPGTARAEPAAQRDHTRALATQLIAAAKQASLAKITALLQVPLHYSLPIWDADECNKKLPAEGTVTRSTLPAFVACLAKQDFSRLDVLVDDDSPDKDAESSSSSFVRFATAPSGRRLISAIEFGAVVRMFGASGPIQDRPLTKPAPGASPPGAAPADKKGPVGIIVELTGPMGALGNLSAEEIDRVVKSRAGLYRACYQKELNHTPDLTGVLILHFQIRGDGPVEADRTSTAPGSTLHNATVEQCVKSRVNGLKFPAKGGVADVKYSFVFTRG